MYAELISEHLKDAVRLYPEKIETLEKHCGFKIHPNGNCTATSWDDVMKYLSGLNEHVNPIAYMSARTRFLSHARSYDVPSEYVKSLY